MCCGAASHLVIQVKQSMPASLFREVPNSCSLISGKPGRRVDEASDDHRETRYWCDAIRKEGYGDLEYATLGPWVRTAEGSEASESSGLPRARAETGSIRKKCRERAARHDRFSSGIEGPRPRYPDGAAERVLRCVRPDQVEAIRCGSGGYRRR